MFYVFAMQATIKQNSILATTYALVLGLAGILALLALTDWNALYAYALPLAFFGVLSFILKRAGFHAAPEVTHSLVGIVDLAAVLVFGPVLGAWVAAVSGFFYLFLNALRREKHTLGDLVEIPMFNAGLKIGMAYASTRAYEFFGGRFPPHTLNLAMVLPIAGAVLGWFLIDHLGWAILEFLRGGRQALNNFLRSILYFSILVELLPLPFSIVIAMVYASGEQGIFLMIALGLIGTAFIVQRFADATRRLEFQSNDLAALNALGQAISKEAFDADKIIDVLHEHARRIITPDVCQIELIDPAHAQGMVLALDAWHGEVRHPNQAVPDPLLREYFATHREPIRSVDLERAFVYPFEATGIARTLQTRVQSDEFNPQSSLIVPMFAGDALIGVLSMFDARKHVFYPTHARSLASMCAQAAVGIQNARLYAVERKRAAQLGAISEVSRQVAQFRDLDEFLRNVVAQIRERFGYSNVHVFTIDDTGRYVVFRASTHPHSIEWREHNIQLRIGLEGIVGWVAATREPLMVPDVQKDPRYVLDPDKELANTRSEVAVPLIVGDQLLGVLDVQSEQVNAFNEDDLFVLKTLAAQMAVAFEDARLYQSQREEAYYLNVLLQVAENLAGTSDIDDALETIVRITPLLVGVARCALFLYLPDEQVFVPGKAYGLSREMYEEFKKMRVPSTNGLAFDRLAHEQKPLVIEDIESSDLAERQYLQAFEVKSVLMVPMIARNELVGAILVDQGSRPTRFTQHEIDVVMGIANQAAAAVESARLTSEAEAKRRLDYELGLARQIQRSFLPDACPVIPGYQICSWWSSAREVSGDFYDFVSLRDNRTAMTIADVSDKGMAAAMFMALSRTILRTMTIGKPTVREAVERANDVILADARSDMFVTVFHAILDPQSHRLTYVNAGHNPPLLYRATTDTVVTLKGHGIALGVLPNITLQECEIYFEPGDMLLMYTDGATDVFNAYEEEFGADRLADLLAVNARKSPDELIEEIKRALSEFSSESVQFDDVTLIALKRM
jgi:serine phosphatase RsbU (regulator of sigma subunit)